MATLQGAIDELIAVIDAVTGVNFAPDDPTEQIPEWPAAVVYMTIGRSINRPPNVITYLHDVTIAFVMPLNELPLCFQVMLPFAETIPEAIYSHRNGRTSSHYATFGEISHTLGPIDWPQGQLMFGYLFTVTDLKLQRELA